MEDHELGVAELRIIGRGSDEEPRMAYYHMRRDRHRRGIIWLLTFPIVCSLIGVVLFISCVVLLFFGAIGPALGCLILCPIAFVIGSAIMEVKDREAERKRILAEKGLYR